MAKVTLIFGLLRRSSCLRIYNWQSPRSPPHPFPPPHTGPTPSPSTPSTTSILPTFPPSPGGGVGARWWRRGAKWVPNGPGDGCRFGLHGCFGKTLFWDPNGPGDWMAWITYCITPQCCMRSPHHSAVRECRSSSKLTYSSKLPHGCQDVGQPYKKSNSHGSISLTWLHTIISACKQQSINQHWRPTI